MSFIIQEQAASGPFANQLDLADYQLTSLFSSFASTSSAQFYCFNIDTTRELFIWAAAGNGGTLITGSDLIGFVFDSSSNSFGNIVLLRASVAGAAPCFMVGKISTTEMLLCSNPYNQTSLETVVLSISGTTITVNTPVATVLPAGVGIGLAPVYTREMLNINGTFLLPIYLNTGATRIYPITVSGTTPTVGSSLNFSSGGNGQLLIQNTATQVLSCRSASSAPTGIHITPVDVSGLTLTAGTAVNITTALSPYYFTLGKLASGNFALSYALNAGGCAGSIITVTGSVATASSVTLDPLTGGTSNRGPMTSLIVGNQQVTSFDLNRTSGSSVLVVLTDVAGVATAGTNLSIGSLSVGIGGYNPTTGQITCLSNIATSSTTNYALNARLSGNNLVLDSVQPLKSTTSGTTLQLQTTWQDGYSGFEFSRYSGGAISTLGAVSLQTSDYTFGTYRSAGLFSYTYKAGETPESISIVDVLNGTPTRSTLSDQTAWYALHVNSILLIQKVTMP